MDYFDIKLDRSEINQKNTLAVAHLGDCVYELMVRTRLTINHSFTNKNLHTATLKYVSAHAQSKAYRLIADTLSEEESAVFIRGRNSHVKTVPRNADRGEYHAATGLETLFGYLYLEGRKERLSELFAIIAEGLEGGGEPV